MEKKYKLLDAIIIGAAGAIVGITILTMWGEQSMSVRSWLKMYFAHHWIGKGILGYVTCGVLFISSYLAPYSISRVQLIKRMQLLVYIPVLAAVVLGVFYVQKFFYYSQAF